MRLACRLLNGDGINFEYAIVQLTPDYAAYLLRLVDEAERLKETHDAFCEIEFMDYEAEYGASLGGLEKDLPEFGRGKPWIEVPDDYEWPDDSQQSIAASTVVVTKGTILWRALGSHDYDGPYFETDELPVEELLRMFPKEPCQCEQPGNFYSGIPEFWLELKMGNWPRVQRWNVVTLASAIHRIGRLSTSWLNWAWCQASSSMYSKVADSVPTANRTKSKAITSTSTAQIAPNVCVALNVTPRGPTCTYCHIFKCSY